MATARLLQVGVVYVVLGDVVVVGWRYRKLHFLEPHAATVGIVSLYIEGYAVL